MRWPAVHASSCGCRCPGEHHPCLLCCMRFGLRPQICLPVSALQPFPAGHFCQHSPSAPLCDLPRRPGLLVRGEICAARSARQDLQGKIFKARYARQDLQVRSGSTPLNSRCASAALKRRHVHARCCHRGRSAQRRGAASSSPLLPARHALLFVARRGPPGRGGALPAAGAAAVAAPCCRARSGCCGPPAESAIQAGSGCYGSPAEFLNTSWHALQTARMLPINTLQLRGLPNPAI